MRRCVLCDRALADGEDLFSHLDGEHRGLSAELMALTLAFAMLEDEKEELRTTLSYCCTRIKLLEEGR